MQYNLVETVNFNYFSIDLHFASFCYRVRPSLLTLDLRLSVHTVLSSERLSVTAAENRSLFHYYAPDLRREGHYKMMGCLSVRLSVCLSRAST